MESSPAKEGAPEQELEQARRLEEENDALEMELALEERELVWAKREYALRVRMTVHERREHVKKELERVRSEKEALFHKIRLQQGEDEPEANDGEQEIDNRPSTLVSGGEPVEVLQSEEETKEIDEKAEDDKQWRDMQTDAHRDARRDAYNDARRDERMYARRAHRDAHSYAHIYAARGYRY